MSDGYVDFETMRREVRNKYPFHKLKSTRQIAAVYKSMKEREENRKRIEENEKKYHQYTLWEFGLEEVKTK